MAWVKIDDKIRNHPKFLRAGPIASWLWLCGQSYCADYLTDGFIPDDALPLLGNMNRPRTYAKRLVNAGLWRREDRGYRVHDYLDYQPSRAHIERVRSVRKQSGKAGGLRSGEARALEANGKQIASTLLQQNRTPVPSPVRTKNKNTDQYPSRSDVP